MGTRVILKSDLSEKQIEQDVANYFGHISRFFGEFRLLDTDEQLTGADKRFNWQGVAYFIQFKKPTGLSEATRVTRAKPKQPARKIRQFRFTEKLDQSPHSVYFGLQPPPNENTELQHNVLFSYECPPLSRAFYVCPTVLSSDEYVKALRYASLDFEFGMPFEFRHPLWVRDGAHVARAAELCPFLRAHAAIVPHRTVTTSKHHYSFSVQATDVAFHEPTLLGQGPTRLSDLLRSEVLARYSDRDALRNPAGLARHLFKASESWSDGALPAPTPDSHWEWIAQHGHVLREDYGIRQFIALVRQERP